MKCQILFPEKNIKNINLSSAENFAQRVVKGKTISVGCKDKRNLQIKGT